MNTRAAAVPTEAPKWAPVLSLLTQDRKEPHQTAVNGDKAGKDQGHTDTAVSTCTEKEGPVYSLAQHKDSQEQGADRDEKGDQVQLYNIIMIRLPSPPGWCCDSSFVRS